jgi:hypothetical protein
MTEADTLNVTPIVKYESGFKFVKIRQKHPKNIDVKNNPNIGYRNIYRIYNLSNGQLLSEIIGEYEGLFGIRADSIDTADCNFDGYPDLIIKYHQETRFGSIYFYNSERQKFFEYPNIKHLENLVVDFQSKTITGKNTAQASVRNKYGQFRDPKKKIWREYEYIDPALKYVKVETITSFPNRGRKVKTNYYLNNDNALVPIRKKEFLMYTNRL